MHVVVVVVVVSPIDVRFVRGGACPPIDRPLITSEVSKLAFFLFPPLPLPVGSLRLCHFSEVP